MTRLITLVLSCAILAALLCGCSKPSPANEDIKQFFQAIRSSDVESVSSSLSRFSQRELIGALDETDFSPIEVAFVTYITARDKGDTSNDSFAILELLLKNGSDARVRGNILINAAATRGDNDLVELLIRHGADVNGTCRESSSSSASSFGYWGLNPLDSAASQSHIDTMNILLKNGADINYSFPNGGNLLTALASSGNCDFEMVEFLIKKGIDTNVRDGYSGLTALEIFEAKDRSHPSALYRNAIQLLKTVGAKG